MFLKALDDSPKVFWIAFKYSRLNHFCIITFGGLDLARQKVWQSVEWTITLAQWTITLATNHSISNNSFGEPDSDRQCDLENRRDQ